MFSTTRKALTAAALAVSLVAALSTPSLADREDDLKKKQREASSEARDAKKDLDESSAKYKRAAAAFEAAQAKLDKAQAKLDQTRGALAVAKALDEAMQAKLTETETQLLAAETRLKVSEAKLAESEAAVQEFTVENLQDGDRGMRAFADLLGGEDPVTFSEQMSLNDSVSDAQIAKMQELAATRVMRRVKRDDVQRLRNLVKAQREDAAANLVKMTKLETQAEKQAASVLEFVKQQRSARYQAKLAQREDLAAYQAKVRERQRIKAQLQALAARDLASGGAGVGGDGGGTLSYPVNGPITSPYGMRWHPITGVYKLHDGVDWGVACGTPIRAAASGKIIQQYYNSAYGNRVILNNGIMRGKSVVTTYNHLSRFIYSAGKHVSRGQVIAYSGTTGYSTGCHLHFMVITNGITVDPMGWL